MTIDEAIRDFRHLESDFEHAMCDIEDTKENLIMYQEKWEYCKQIAEWLQELKAYKENEFDVLKQDGQLLYKQGVVDGYDKAVDDLIEKCKSAMFSEKDEITLSDFQQGANGGLRMAIHFAEQLKEANRTMTNQEARQIVQNFPNWNMDDQWLSDAEMKELVKVLDNALENIIEIKKHKITLSDLENYMKFEDECVKKNFTLKSLLEAREKQIAKKPILKSGTEVIHVNREKGPHELIKSKYQDWTCPACGYFVGQRYNSTQLTHDQRKRKFCSECGQKIDWSEEDE